MGCVSTKEPEPGYHPQLEKPQDFHAIGGKNRNIPPAKIGGHRRGKEAPVVLALYGGSWYAATVTNTSGSTVDLLWDDGSYSPNVPKSQVCFLRPGLEAEGQWGGVWYPCTIKRIGTMDEVKGPHSPYQRHSRSPPIDVQWDDGSHSAGISMTCLRPRPRASPLPRPPADDIDSPNRKGVFGRRPVLTPGTDIEALTSDGVWRNGRVVKVGDTCLVEWSRGGRAAVPLHNVRIPDPDLYNFDATN
eukprot:Sspe_Gene.105401::Locus_82439_Transcript_1_1_Confidence_1.000_Length_821::g.105401::m.105401